LRVFRPVGEAGRSDAGARVAGDPRLELRIQLIGARHGFAVQRPAGMSRELGVALVRMTHGAPESDRIPAVDQDWKLQLARRLEQLIELGLVDAQELAMGSSHAEAKAFGDF